uniref:AH domain-containing protein n=1 Tax=Globodera rostochiensis TaxID=31243 RepID=A0A914I9E0_GLORO
MLNAARKIRLLADVVDIEKDEKGHIGISIGGGAPYCTCLYIVQIFENSPARKNGLLDGFEKNAVASLIRDTKGIVRISFNRLQFDAEMGQNLDIFMKKFKHRLVDSMDDATADALGLSRAILCNDVLAQLRSRLDHKEQFYRALVKKAEETVRCYQQMASTQTAIGAVLAEIHARERPLSDDGTDGIGRMAELANAHKTFGKEHWALAQSVGELVQALQGHANAAIPDARQSLNRYSDAKYEYLAHCLRAKELEDEEVETAFEGGEQLQRMATGNYDYRMTLKSRELSRANFLARREQAAVKIELLGEKHVRELALQLKNLIDATKAAHVACRRAGADPVSNKQ